MIIADLNVMRWRTGRVIRDGFPIWPDKCSSVFHDLFIYYILFKLYKKSCTMRVRSTVSSMSEIIYLSVWILSH